MFATLLLALLWEEAATGVGDPTYWREIEPMLARSCIGCHYPGGPSPFSLTSYLDVKKRAELIRTVVIVRTMPPTDAESDFGKLVTERLFSDEETVTLQEWIRTGMREGDTGAARSPAPKARGWSGGQPHITLTPVGVPPVKAEGNPYWVVVSIPLNSATDLEIEGFQVRTATPFALRNVLLARDDYGVLTRQAPFETAGSMGISANAMIGSWSPGYYGWGQSRAGYALVPKGKNLIAQVLYSPTGKVEDGRFEVGLHLRKKPSGSERARWMSIGTDSLNIGSREVIVQRVERRISEDVSVLAIVPEARAIASQLRLIAHLPGEEPKTLLRVFSWDRFWTGAYNFSKPVFLPKGTVLRTEFVFDNRDHTRPAPQSETKPVKYGLKEGDEMCWMHVQYIRASSAK